MRFDGAPIAVRDIDRMGRTLAHRGPDGTATAVEDNVAMGHCLLRVNQEDWFEEQPLRDSGLLAVADARIDNREALAAEIGITEAALREMPDSAVLLAAYRHWGEGFAEHLLGDFTFAIWDARTRALILGRDHMGQRGLYYHHGDGVFAFASEAQALWAVEGVPRRLSEDGLGRWLLGAIDRIPGQTMFEEVVILPNATVLRVEATGVTASQRYWEPRAGAAHRGGDDAYFLATYRATVEEAIACRVRRLIAPPALCFSGGFDSGIIAAVAGPIAAAQGRRLVAVSSVLPDGEKLPFSNSARAAVELFRPYPFMDVHYYMRGEDDSFSEIEAAFAASYHPVGTQYVRRGLFRLAAAAGARLIMDGHGGDYTVNMRSKAMLGRILLRGHVVRFVREFRMRMRATGGRAHFVARSDVLPALTPLWVQALSTWARRRFRPAWRNKGLAPGFVRSLVARGAIDPARLRAVHPTDSRWQARLLQILRNVAGAPPGQNILAGSHGLEFSRPFHDKRVVELGLAIPEALQFRDGVERYLARRAFADRLPAPLLARVRGNSLEDPDRFLMGKLQAPAALAATRALDREGRLSRYLDFDALETIIAAADPMRGADHNALQEATMKITAARFIAWFDRSNS
jgi:asparagine synthase (glutamine-hydrolysing)